MITIKSKKNFNGNNPLYDFRFFHHHKRRVNNAARKTLPKLAPLKRKPPTIPKDPFSLKSERDSKRPWLKDPALAKGDCIRFCVSAYEY